MILGILKKELLVIIAASILVGCATTAIPTKEARPTTDILNLDMTTQLPSTATLIIKRDVGSVGSACAIRTFVDGKPLANIRTGQMVTAYLKPGEYVLRASSTGICGGGDAESSVVMRIGDIRVYRISIDQGASIRLGPTSQ